MRTADSCHNYALCIILSSFTNQIKWIIYKMASMNRLHETFVCSNVQVKAKRMATQAFSANILWLFWLPKTTCTFSLTSFYWLRVRKDWPCEVGIVDAWNIDMEFWSCEVPLKTLNHRQAGRWCKTYSSLPMFQVSFILHAWATFVPPKLKRICFHLFWNLLK